MAESVKKQCSDAWMACVPTEYCKVSRVVGFSRGILTVEVFDAESRYELEELLRVTELAKDVQAQLPMTVAEIRLLAGARDPKDTLGRTFCTQQEAKENRAGIPAGMASRESAMLYIRTWFYLERNMAEIVAFCPLITDAVALLRKKGVERCTEYRVDVAIRFSAEIRDLWMKVDPKEDLSYSNVIRLYEDNGWGMVVAPSSYLAYQWYTTEMVNTINKKILSQEHELDKHLGMQAYIDQITERMSWNYPLPGKMTHTNMAKAQRATIAVMRSKRESSEKAAAASAASG